MAKKAVFGTAAVVCFAGMFLAAPLGAQQTGTTSLGVTIGPECRVQVTSSTSASGPDGSSGTIHFTYQIRTSKGAGSGSVELLVSGRDVDSSQFTYTTTLGGRGEALSGAGLPATVAAFGPNAHSSRAGDSGTVTWALRGVYAAAPDVRLAMRCF